MKSILVFFISILTFFSGYGQNKSPYKLRLWVDMPVSIAGAGLSYIGLQKLRNKPYLDSAKVASLDPSQINKFDRSATRHYDPNASLIADIGLYASIALPGLLLTNDNVNKEKLKVAALYVETMAVMGVAYTWGLGMTYRIRPYVYNPDVNFKKKLGRGTTNSFYAGHPAGAAAATFFFAKVYADYNPDSKLKPYVWSAALIPPAIVAYFRYRRGQHFPSDILVGIPLGAAIGIIVPQLHKVSNKTNLSLIPTYRGFLLTYTFDKKKQLPNL
jgi:membrane-associated phospholipid phosphatase